MLTLEEAEGFARNWIRAWNRHDLEAVLSHYAENVELISPLVAQVLGDPSGIIRGKDHLRMLFSMGLSMFPDLHLELLQVFAGVSSLVVCYQGVDGTQAAEVMVLNPQGQVVRAMGHYSLRGGWDQGKDAGCR